MKIQKIILVFIFGVIALILSSSTVVAGNVDGYIGDGWLSFSWNNYGVYGCSPADPDGLPCSPSIVAIPAVAPPWTFTAPSQGIMLKVVDIYSSGDQFQIFDGGVPIGSTSGSQTGSYCGGDPSICLSNPAMSSGAFQLEVGEHSITIAMLNNPFGVGAACFHLEVVIPGLSQIAGLIEAVENLALEGKIKDNQAQALVKILEKTLEKLNLGKTGSGCSKLDDFATLVMEFIGDNVVSWDDGYPLVETTCQIQESVDCQSFQGE